MMRFTLSAIILFSFLTPLSLQAQSDTIFPDLKIGEWQQHLPWQRIRSVTGSDSKIYCGTEWSVVEIDPVDRAPKFLYKTEGLNDVGIKMIKFNKVADVLFIGYNNSNIDLYYPASGKVVNLPFILKNTVLAGDKALKTICFDDKFAYIGAGFGVVKLDLVTADVVFTVFTGVPVQSFAVYKNQYYMGTEDGLFRIAVDDDNPADFGRWNLLGAPEGFVAGEPVRAMSPFGEFLFLGGDNSGLMRYNGAEPPVIMDAIPDSKITFLTNEGTGLVSGWRFSNGTGRIMYLETNGTYANLEGPCDARRPLDGIEFGTKKFWFADDFDQFRYYDADTGKCDFFTYNSPYSHHVSEVAVRGNKVFVATLGADPNLNPQFSKYGLYVRDENGDWRRINGDSNPELLADTCDLDWWRVAPHPTEEKVYVGSFNKGLVEMKDNGTDTRCYKQTNSILQNAGESGPNRTAIGGMIFDKDNNLWICNYGAKKPVAVLKPDGTLLNFDILGTRQFLQVVVDNNGYKWFVSAFTGSLTVFDSGDNLDDPSDDRYKVLNVSNSVLATSEVTAEAVDLDGDVWVGTKEGLYSFECTSAIFNAENPCKGTRQIVTVDGFNGYLLQDELIKCIAIDGANRKWVGTTNGIFVQSADGRTTLGRYTISNSPLPSNFIEDIAINQASGEVWIGTGAGLISLRTDATLGGNVNTKKPYAYPNPVRPDYDGPIAIYGLARDANVKITDVAGHLVYEGTANGGQAIWNGRDYLGRRAASGVYLVYATSSTSFDTPDAIVTKVVIVN